VEIIRDGEVAFAQDNPDRATAGTVEAALDVAGAGWVAARCWGRQRTSYAHPLWAHTSPVYLRKSAAPPRVRAASDYFVERIDAARAWIATSARFDTAGQRDRMLQIFADGRDEFERLNRDAR
jgi:hypothetical protein